MNPIKGFERYFITRNGKIYSSISKKYLRQNKTKSGYCSVELFGENGKSKRLLVHRIVATAFIPNPDNLPEVNHKDQNPSNNCVSNLEWCDRKYNMNYGTLQKKKRKALNWFYSSDRLKENARKNGAIVSKAVLQFSRDGVFIKRYNSAAEASRTTGANHSHILECCHGKRYKTVNGFIWKFEKV